MSDEKPCTVLVGRQTIGSTPPPRFKCGRPLHEHRSGGGYHIVDHGYETEETPESTEAGR